MKTSAIQPGFWGKIIFMFILTGFLIGLAGGITPGRAQDMTPTTPPAEIPTVMPGSPVEVGGKVLFYVYERVGSYSPSERAASIAQRISTLASNPFAPSIEITLAESSEGIDIMAGETILATVTKNDASAVNMTPQAAAEEAAVRIQSAVESIRQQNTPRARLIRIAQTILILLALVLLFIIVNRLHRWLEWRLDEDLQHKKGVFSKGELLRQTSTVHTFKIMLNVMRWVIIVLIFAILLPLGLKIFPATAAVAEQFLQLLLAPLQAFWSWLITNQKNFVTIAIIIIITYVLIRLVKFFFKEIEIGVIKFRGFDPEWARFTGRISAFLLIVAAIVVAYPYLPGSDSEAFKGITIFLGALFTLSSTAAVSNIVAGVIQTYTGAFRVGDVIKIGLVTGIVTEKRLLATRVRTFKNEEVSIPNSTVITVDVTNYSEMAKGKGLILYTTVTIGYDVPWKQVYELLIAAAMQTPDILPTPAPFVMQTALNDFNVAYQINCYTKRPDRMYRLYSVLHQNIQDQFNQAGVEIMSPTYTAVRDGNTVTIPPEQRPADYQVPGFRIEQ